MSMNSEELMRKVLACFPGHSDHSIKLGDIILSQHVATCCNVGIFEAKAWLDQLCNDGYLVYEEATDQKVAGYHITEKGVDFYNS